MKEDDYESFVAKYEEIFAYLASSRPTAVNLFWALNRMKNTLVANKEHPMPTVKMSPIATSWFPMFTPPFGIICNNSM